MNELNKILFGSKISREGMERMNKLGLLPKLSDIKDWKKTFCGRFICKYPKYYGIITKMQKLLGRLPEWEDFTKSNIDDILSLFSSCSPSSIRTYTAMLKAVLNDGKDEFVLPYPKFAERLNVKGTPSVNVYLNLDELSRLEQYRPKNEKENIVLVLLQWLQLYSFSCLRMLYNLLGCSLLSFQEYPNVGHPYNNLSRTEPIQYSLSHSLVGIVQVLKAHPG